MRVLMLCTRERRTGTTISVQGGESKAEDQGDGHGANHWEDSPSMSQANLLKSKLTPMAMSRAGSRCQTLNSE